MAGFLRKIKDSTPSEVKDFWHYFKAKLAAFYFSRPSQSMKVVGVTGTNGKTTTCHLIANILESAGYKVGMITTTTIKIEGESMVNKLKMTTPEPFTLQRMIKKMKDKGCKYLVIETSSHAIAQSRVVGVEFDIAVMTNLTREHLDYHKNFKDYKEAKLWLFKNLTEFTRKPSTPKVAVLNRDDRSFEEFSKEESDRTLSYGILRGDVVANSPAYHENGTQFLAQTPLGKKRLKINLPGRFNLYNGLAAITAGIGLGLDLDKIEKGLKKVTQVPGRMELINQGQDFEVIVDYAHTPDGLNQVLETLKPSLKGNLITVVGAEGRRSKTKRPLLGALCGRYSDYIIVTNVDPRDEDPGEIIDDVAEGVKRGTKKEEKKKRLNEQIFKIPDRRKAIKKAFELAKPQDTVLLLAKGAEQAIEFEDRKISWDDRRVARRLLKERQERHR